MRYSFTPAAERALAEAATWTSGEFFDALEAPALLLGLLAETECRAALILTGLGIDVATVQERWPSLTRLSTRFPSWEGVLTPLDPPDGGLPVRHICPEVQVSLSAAARQLRSCGLPIELGTEHVLWGLAGGDHEVSDWLRQKGVRPDVLEAEIHRVHGHQTGPEAPGALAPLPFDAAEQVEAIETRGAECPVPTGEYSVPTTIANRSHRSAAITPMERLQALRVIDAAANRAREGLRVVEDYVRFVLDDPYLTSVLKGLRHELAEVIGRLPSSERLAARETLADVGTHFATPAELCREDTASVLAANFSRLQESLRSLEEFAKILDPAASAAFENLRYQSYTLHRAAEMTRMGFERLHHARLYVLIDGRSTPEEFSRLARSLVSSGVHVIQLRDKRLEDRALLQRARMLRDIAAEGNVVFIVNDRPDLAVLSRADGVHIGQEEMSVKDARTVVGPQAIIGVSTHSIQQARRAVLDGANYIGVGPTFPSETKHFERFPGVELLRAVHAEIRLPAFAIGGICLENLPLVLETGFRRIAIGAAITRAASAESTATAFLTALG